MAFFNPYPVNSNGAVASLVAKVNTVISGGQIARLHRLIATNTAGANTFVQIFDAVTAPGNGAVPLISFPLTAAPTVGSSTQPPIDFGVYGRTFQNGIVVVNSSTEATLTLSTANLVLDLLVS